MATQDIRQNGIDWLVDEIGRLRMTVEQQRAEIKADNDYAQRITKNSDSKQRIIESQQRIIQANAEDFQQLVMNHRDALAINTKLVQERDALEVTVAELRQQDMNRRYGHGLDFPQIITNPDMTLCEFVRQLSYMIGWLDRRLYGLHTTGVVDVDMPALINDLRTLAGDTRKLYHKLEDQLDNPVADVNVGVDEGSPDDDATGIAFMDANGRIVATFTFQQ